MSAASEGGEDGGPGSWDAAEGQLQRSRKRTKQGIYTSGAQDLSGACREPLLQDGAPAALRRRAALHRSQDEQWPTLPLPPAADVTLEDLSAHFHLPASKACQELGMGCVPALRARRMPARISQNPKCCTCACELRM